MKIAFFADTYFPHMTGVAVSIKSYYQKLKELGYNLLLFAPSVPKYRDEDSSIIRLPSLRISPFLPPQGRIPLIIPNSNFRRIFTEDYQIIHAHGSGFFSALAIIVAKLRKLPVLVTFHTDWQRYTHYLPLVPPKVVNLGLKIMANCVDCNIVPSKKMQSVLEKIGVKKPIEVVPGFIDINRFNNQKKGFLRQVSQIPKDHQIVLSTGRISKEKRFDFLIKVQEEVLKQLPNCHLIIAGLGPEKKNLINLAEKLNLKRRIHIIGPFKYKDMPQIYADADIFTFASDSETQGLAVLEAAASGLPLVILNDPAFDGMIQNGFNGYSLELNKSLFAQKIVYLLKDQNLKQEFAENSRKIVKKNFDSKIIMEKLIKIYEKLLNDGS